ncbi:MAG: hypothetical protein MJ072_05495, partial [Clostridia bacterium]|nr:hypothetical protein [Clostridia bacterium]
VEGGTVEYVAVGGCREFGCLVGYAGGTYEVSGNTVKDSKVINDRTGGYKSDYTTDAQYDVHEIIGEQGTAGAVSENTATNVTIQNIIPIVPVGEQTVKQAFDEKISGAAAGSILSVPASEDLTLPNISQNITLVGTLDEDGNPETKVNAVGGGSIASVPNGATFENMEFTFGTSNYHGFQHAGTIIFKNCVLNGLLISYGNMIFENCVFNAIGSEYSMWAYGKDLTYNNCVFNGHGKWINVYCENNTVAYNITFNECHFVNDSTANKAAVNVKDSCGDVQLMYNVSINNCTYEGNFPAASTSDTKIVVSPLVMIDDIKDLTDTNLLVKVDGVTVFTKKVN